MPRSNGVWGVEWDICDRCGFEHPINMLSMQLGMKLCSDHGCLDDLEPYFRPKIIADTLARGREGTSEKSEVFRAQNDLRW